MIQSQLLPPGKSIRDYPVVLPDQEMTEEQGQQAQMAQIAGIVLASAAGKKAVMDTVTNQIVALLRVTDLTSEVAVRIFAKQAAYLVRFAMAQAKRISWSGVAARAAVVDIDMPSTPPGDDEIEPKLRNSRGTDLETAYARLAQEYAKHRSKTIADPAIKMLVEEYENQALTPLPRPDNISNDAIQRVVSGEEEWRKAFAKAEEEALQDQGRKITIFETEDEETEAGIRAEAAARAREAQREAERVAAESSSGSAGDEGSASRDEGSSAEAGSEGSDTEADEDAGAVLTLTPAEVDEVVERYAQQKVEERAERMVNHDVQASSRNMHQVALQQLPQEKVVGFRRVVHPELAESGRSCGLCIVASTMWYTRRDLLPIHAGCNCETCEIYEIDGVMFDPGEQINMEDLNVFYREAGDTTHGWDLKRQAYEVFDHPEYGPTLRNVKSEYVEAENVPFEKKEVNNARE